MSDRERAREIALPCFKPGQIGPRKLDKLTAAIATALAQARAEGLRQAAEKVEALTDDEGPEGEALQSAYNDHPPKTYVNERLRAYHRAIAARLRALAEGGE